MSKHTPTPWTWLIVGTGGPQDNPTDICEIVTMDRHARIAEHVSEDDARHICTAVNAHDALSGALFIIATHSKDTFASKIASDALRAAGVEP